MKTAKRKGGRGLCTVCSHRDHAAIDSLLSTGGPLDSIAERYRLSRSSLQRHKSNHPIRVLGVSERDVHEAKTAANVESGMGQAAGMVVNLPAELQAQFERTLAAVRSANRSGSHQAIDSAHREHRLTVALLADYNNEQRKLEILARPTGDVLNVLTTEAWRETTVLLFKLLAPWPEVRIAVSKGLAKHHREHGAPEPTE